MKKWQKVRRMTPKQKGLVLERLGDEYWLAKHHEYVVLLRGTGKLSDYILRRCPHCGQIHIWTTDSWPYPGPVVCGACGKQSERKGERNVGNALD